MHKVLKRQLKKLKRDAAGGSIDVDRLIDVVNETYDDFDHERILKDRSMELASQEILELNQRIMQQAATRVRIIMDNVVDGIITFDGNGIIESVNPAAEAIFGFGSNMLLGISIQLLLPEEFLEEIMDRLHRVVNNPGEKMSGSISEITGLRRGKTQFPLEWAMSRMRLGDHESYIAIVRDITNRKKAEEDLRRSKEVAEAANKAKSEFLANMSHELRTPMNSILGFAELIDSEIKDYRHREYTQAILSSGRSLLTLINDILDLSKIDAGKLSFEIRPVNPRKIFEEVQSIYRFKSEEKELKFKLDICPNLPPAAMLDETRLRQILVNLVGNSIKFTHQGHIRLSVDCSEVDQDKGTVDFLFVVEDTGIGIPKDQQRQVFRAFEQQDGQDSRVYGGTGLGLAITRRLVEMMGGTISLESEVGVGTAFIVRLPSVELATCHGEHVIVSAVDSHPVEFKSATVLLAEDNRLNRKLVRGYLAKTGVEIIEAVNGEVAVDTAKRIRPDIILMDIQMPKMDGYEATRQIKGDGELNTIPIVALTANAMKTDREKALAAGCDTFITKPVSRQNLIATLAKYLNAST